MRLPIVAGRLRGKWWIPASGGKVIRVLNGTYEREQTEFFRNELRPGGTVVDIGAHVGYYTLLSAELVGPTGKVVAFEPNPRNFAFLRRHVTINRCHNVDVEQLAVADRSGAEGFQAGAGSGTGRLVEAGGLSVRTVTVDEFCGARALRPTAMKIDVEGAELRVLRGAKAILERDRPVIFLSTHGAQVHAECLRLLTDLGYSLRPMIGDSLETTSEVLARPTPTHVG